jgi:hypothetical protein
MVSRSGRVGASLTSLLAVLSGLTPAAAQEAGAAFSGSYRHFSGNLVDLIPSLYGGDGIRLAADEAFSHAAHFTNGSLQTFNSLSLNVRDLSFPVLNAQAGVTFDYDPVLDEFVASNGAVGASAFAFDAQTVRDGGFQLGLAYSVRRFDSLNGNSLSDITVDLQHMDLGDNGPDLPCLGGPTGACYTFERDVVRLSIDLDIKEEMYAFSGTYGISDRLDAGLFLPLLKTRLRALSVASVVEHDTHVYFPTMLHRFDDQSDAPVDALESTKTGIGDTVLRFNYRLTDGAGTGWHLMTGLDIRLPTGAVEDLQGLPRVGARPRVVASREYDAIGGRLRPHLNVSYGFNAGQAHEQVLDYALGASYSRAWGDSLGFAVSADFLGKHVTRGRDALGDNQYDLAFGVKILPLRDFNLYYNILVPINDSGLRPDAQHVVGLQVKF